MPLPPFLKAALNRSASDPGVGLPKPSMLVTLSRRPSSSLADLSLRSALTTLSIPFLASCSLTCAILNAVKGAFAALDAPLLNGFSSVGPLLVWKVQAGEKFIAKSTEAKTTKNTDFMVDMIPPERKQTLVFKKYD